ncbi:MULTISPECIES: hypothetical protein [Vibrio]|uniref:Uncharacterized protein n=1 Tax=Vibrio vulnificus TaxID=672 RepID=A0A2S3R1D2_VIBVL|nr:MULTISPECIES: hypothetical protein [Vibrio]MCZ2801999.1 hypothetical protein [Vibrio alginolyticus]POB46916.1 hypothetical protein CRN52_12615 [Vibrio vulnificus]
MTDIITLLSNHPIILAVFAIIAAFGMHYSHSQLKAFRTAKEIIRTQNNPVDPKIVDELIEDAKQMGDEKYVLGILREIRTKYGHSGVKVGHVMWIVHLRETGYPDINDIKIPSFHRDDKIPD